MSFDTTHVCRHLGVTLSAWQARGCCAQDDLGFARQRCTHLKSQIPFFLKSGSSYTWQETLPKGMSKVLSPEDEAPGLGFLLPSGRRLVIAEFIGD